jgi:hypothetical protein
MIVKISIVAIIFICSFCSCVFAYTAGYRKRAMEDKKSLEDALVAQFRAEHAADAYRRRALALLHALTFGTPKKSKG